MAAGEFRNQADIISIFILLNDDREKALKLLSQFPSIGPIPAPAKSVCLGLKGTLDGKEAEVEIGFQWPNNKLKIAFVNFK